MKVVVLGASGWIGSHIVNEAKLRGHHVIALVRNAENYAVEDVEIRQFDLNSSNSSLLDAVQGADVAIASIGGRAKGNHDIVAATANRLLETLPDANIDRLLWVGGAGSLEVAPGVPLISVPEFPAEYKAEAVAQGEALNAFKEAKSPLDWTFISPAAEIFPGDSQSAYRVGGDQLLTDSQGNSRISVADYAVAMIDELEAHKYSKQRIGIAY